MTDSSARAAAVVVIANLVAFLTIVAAPPFQAAHHHWIFPALAAVLAAEWALTFAPSPIDGAAERGALREGVVWAFVLLLVMGIARHATILACFDKCSFKLAGAAALAGTVFLGQSFVPGRFWTSLRAGLASGGAWLWALYLVLRGVNAAPWMIDTAFVILALMCWLGRDRPGFLITALIVPVALAVRATVNEYAIIGFSVLWSVALPLAAAPRVAAWLEVRPGGKPAPKDETPLARRALASALRIAAAVAVIVGIARFVAGPMRLVTDPGRRRAYLTARAPEKTGVKQLSPLAARLRGHVVMLAETIGPRDAYSRKGRERARDYVAERLRAIGYAPKALPYESRFLAGVPDGTLFHNVEAVLPGKAGGPKDVWLVGAHYDSAAGTPGADDDASGVAVLIEAARLLREKRPAREVRFVAFGTEEPPSFGTRNMGSWHYARLAKDGNVPVHGMISLEMLGFYNTRPASQLYPPFLHLFFPSRGDYVGAVANLESRALLASFGAAWRNSSRFPLVSSALPGPLSGLALSDQLNFWDQGFPALMLSDTAFYRNPHYHEASDLPDTLDYERMAEVASALAAALAEEP